MYHITSRGDDRKKIFLSEQDFKKFLEYLQAAKEKYEFYVYAWCLMSNHYHVLLETRHPNLSRIMQSLNTAYTVYYNIKRKRAGHLFQGRYKSILVDKDNYLLELTRYIHLNPVRAKIVDLPEQYRWSSYREYVRKTRGGLVDKKELERYFRMDAARYAEFVRQGIKESQDPFSGLYAGFILGKVKFIKETLGDLKDLIESGDYAHKRRVGGIEARDIINTVAGYYKIDAELLCTSKKSTDVPRKVTVYLLKRYSHLTNKSIGAEFGITYSAVSKIARQVERLTEENKRIKSDVAGIISQFKV